MSIELLLDLFALSMGVLIIFQAKDNYLKLYWGVIAAGIGSFFIWENVGWLLKVADEPAYQFTDLLNIEKMLKWYALASLVSLFPTASLRPGYFHHLRLLVFLLPPVVVITIGLCYLNFNGFVTPLHSVEQIVAAAGVPDVRLRLGLFAVSVVLPLVFTIYPMANQGIYRRLNRNMYFFIGFLFLFLGIYILFTISINEFVFNLFGAAALVFVLLFSSLYLVRENPFSDHLRVLDSKSKSNCKTANYPPPLSPHPGTVPGASAAFQRIDDWMKTGKYFTNSHYQLKDLAAGLGEKESAVAKAIKEGGFSGFREYMNCLRLEYFHHLAEEDATKTVKELMYVAGFTSRSSFYRLFADKYGTTPSKFFNREEGKD